MMPGPETPDPVASRAIEERVELMRMCAARILDNARCGRGPDPHALEWAKAIVRNVRPLQGHMSEGAP